MAKRIVTKIGDIFCVKINETQKRYFQYFAIDKTQLNSSTIRVFKRIYPMDYVLNEEEVVNDEVDFYAHTVLKFGIVENCWEKVGKSKNLGNTEGIMFRITTSPICPPPCWQVWAINSPYITYQTLPPEYKNLDWGPVIAYTLLVNRIKYGHFSPVIDNLLKY